MRLRLCDPDRSLRSVVLDSDGHTGRCQWRAGWWSCDLGRLPVRRLEYRFAVTRADGRTSSELDPLCTNVVDTAYGRKSVWQRADYDPPTWLAAPGVPGRLKHLELPSALTGTLPVDLWVPHGLRRRTAAPLLWCHDGPEYAQRAALLQWAAAHIESGDLPPFRVALAGVRSRMQWYSASPRYLRSVGLALDTLHERYAVRAPVAVMGASLGGLTSLLVGLGDVRVGAVLSQSGSFFDPMLDQDESQFRWFGRIAAAVRAVREAESTDRPLHIGMTVGRGEGNRADNDAMAADLRRLGHDVTLRHIPDLHNYVAWRDSLNPIWPKLLQTCWSETR
ncbi:alpha/beta hydrolase [Leekyejoonella antrihumi]|uniref:Esterase n=1 Tax=Leekyejoonella antrihumi TaxID=1660198 RepID=A0A563E1W8_9MICO|nr:alpha/beta hydrolase-fold protein [Leekyejoonella antrihumi]TWP36538.1 hypothetical protein FGL98_10035 [Leekyejoonella antrihumi]